jgi:lipid-binding SYLF domain-containing protein
MMSAVDLPSEPAEGDAATIITTSNNHNNIISSPTEDAVKDGEDHETTTNNNADTTASSSEELQFHSQATLSRPWQYDDLQATCSHCQAEFTAMERRHHCRSCGEIFCNRCSSKRALIPPSSIVLAPKGGKKKTSEDLVSEIASFSPDTDPDRMLTFISPEKELLYGKGLEERFHLAREPLRVCYACFEQLAPLQDALVHTNSNAMRFNTIDPNDPRRLFNSPLAFTLGHEIRKASYTLNNLLPLPKRRMGALTTSFSSPSSSSSSQQQQHLPSSLLFIETTQNNDIQHCKESCSGMSPNLGDLDGVRIPARLLEQAKGVAVMTVAKGGFGLAGIEFGTGLVVARLGENRWSAPSAIGTAGLSWGALIGAQVSDHVFLLMTDQAVELLFQQGSVQLGADVGIALGPLGRSAEADFGAAPGTVASIYSYSLSKGFYAGVSLDGKVIVTRPKVNEKFYGRSVTGMQILQGVVPSPPAAQPLYEALTRCHVYATGNRRTTPSAANAGQPSTPMPILPTGRIIDSEASEYGEIDTNVEQDLFPSVGAATSHSSPIIDGTPTL